MSEAAPELHADSGGHWWLAWFAVWSPPVASIGVLMLGGRLFPGHSDATVVAGLAVGLCGLSGVFVAVAGAVDSLLATLNASEMPSRERARLSLLSLFGVVLSLLGMGALLCWAGSS